VNGENGMRHDNPAKKGVNFIKRDVFVFAFFLLLSFILWYLNSLSKEVETDIRYPLTYVNPPKERVVVEETLPKLSIYLKGPGYSILKLKVSGDKPPVIVDISKVNYKRIPDSKGPNYYILSSGLTKSLTVQLRSGCEITSIKPDTLFFKLEKATAKGK
jgi:hypothetical protein